MTDKEAIKIMKQERSYRKTTIYLETQHDCYNTDKKYNCEEAGKCKECEITIHRKKTVEAYDIAISALREREAERQSEQINFTDDELNECKQFRESGLLWWINMILHTFGWAIVYEVEDSEVMKILPKRVKARGFDRHLNIEGYIKVSDYMKKMADTLKLEARGIEENM